MNTFYFFVLGYSKSNGIGLQMSWSQWVLVKKKKTFHSEFLKLNKFLSDFSF